MVKKRIIIPLLLLIAVGVAGYVYWDRNLRGYVSTDDAFVEADQVNISSMTLERIVHLFADEGDSVQEGQLLVQFADSSRLYAPSSGVVARRWVSESEVVQPGQPILTIYNLNEVWVRANLEETKIARIKPGDKVRVTIDAYKGRVWGGTVALIGSAAASQFSLIPPNNASGNFTKVTQRIPVKIVLEGHTGTEAGATSTGRIPLLPGMSAEVKIKIVGR